LENKVADSQVEKKSSESVIDNDQPVKQDDKKTENLIPQSRFNEQNAKLQEAMDVINSMKAKDSDRKKKEMEKNGEYKELIAQQKSEIEELAEYKVKYNAEQTARREKLISQLPEEKREQYKDHPMNFLEDAVEVLTSKPTQARVDTTSPLNNLGISNPKDALTKLSPEDRKKNWSKIVQAFKKN